MSPAFLLQLSFLYNLLNICYISRDDSFGDLHSIQLDEGINKIYFTNNDLQKNTKIYFKIIWTDGSNASNCIINSEPELNIQTG